MGHYVAIAMVWASFALGLAMFFTMLGEPAEDRGVTQHLYTWFNVGGFTADVGFQLDQLSMIFVLLITGVGGLIHIYSVGYMADDPDRRKFFAYLNLFVAAMLLLVLADNFALLYFGWEGVGLASHLLVGFWQYSPARRGGGEEGLRHEPRRRLRARPGRVPSSLPPSARWPTRRSSPRPRGQHDGDQHHRVLLLVGACAKSAQFPLHAWLFDAMEGLTPVSALIHAATMVTAGVYLIARANPIFNLAHVASTVVIIVGCISLLAGAIIGMARDEIKKALAGSTMSQIGYMIVAVGLGPAGYIFGIFHLLLHGFFKADLFLGAGSVMHAMNNEEDMRRYGALRKVMMVTFITFGAGYLAIMGIPPFDGFYPRTRSSRPPSGPTSGWGWSPHRGDADRLLHDADLRDDVPGQGPLERRRAPARVAQVDDHPDVHPGPAEHRRGLPAGLQRQLRTLAGTGPGLHRA